MGLITPACGFDSRPRNKDTKQGPVRGVLLCIFVAGSKVLLHLTCGNRKAQAYFRTSENAEPGSRKVFVTTKTYL